MAILQGSSSSKSWKRGIPMISAASGRSPALRDSMVCTMFSCAGTTQQLQCFILTTLKRKKTTFQ